MEFRSLYSIINKDENNALIKLTDESHPIFQAHFPNNPILPGFIHFEIINEVFGIEILNIKKAKFNHIIRPNDFINYEINNSKIKVLSKDLDIELVSIVL